MSVFVLGPTRWRKGYAPVIPHWVEETLPALWERRGRKRLWPIDVRAALVEYLQSHGHSGTIMEAHEPREGEPNIGLFNRIEREAGVDQHFVFWPYGAQRTGVDVEFGVLLERFEKGAELDVRLFVEETAGTIAGGSFEALEKGRRTTYYEDLVSYGCPVISWKSYDELFDSMVHHAGSF